MEKPIETIWREGFLESEALVAPKLNNLYTQKSLYLVDKLKKMFWINNTLIVVMAVIFFVVHYFMDAILQGTCVMLLFFGVAWYSYYQMKKIKNINQGMNSYDFLKAFKDWLKNSLFKTALVMRLFYPLTFIAAISTIWFAGDNEIILREKLSSVYTNLMYIYDIPLAVLVFVLIIALVIAFFSDKLYQWDVRLVYGRIFKKLDETIAEMEELKS